jgi:hypothetical protein
MLGTLQTPPVGREARIDAGVLLRRLQRGESVGMPDSRPMATIGRRVHERRVIDRETRKTWRIVCKIDPDAILVVHWFEMLIWALFALGSDRKEIGKLLAA